MLLLLLYAFYTVIYWFSWKLTFLPDFFLIFLNFYSVTIVCIFSPSLHPTPANPNSLPHPYLPPWFCPCVLYSSSWLLSPSTRLNLYKDIRIRRERFEENSSEKFTLWQPIVFSPEGQWCSVSSNLLCFRSKDNRLPSDHQRDSPMVPAAEHRNRASTFQEILKERGASRLLW